MKQMLLSLLLVLASLSCLKSEDGSVIVDPNAVAKIEAGVDAGAAMSQLLAPLIGPFAYLISGGLLTALGIWRRVKPQIMAAKGEAVVANSTSFAIVEAIELLKKDHPETWAQLSPKITEMVAKSGMNPTIIENVIRGLRGLPPKG